MTDKINQELSDDDLDRLLVHATLPVPLPGFEERILKALDQRQISNNVIAFPTPRKTRVWLSGIPLAASLVLGVLIGASDTGGNFLPTSATVVAQNFSNFFSNNSSDELDYLTEDSSS